MPRTPAEVRLTLDIPAREYLSLRYACFSFGVDSKGGVFRQDVAERDETGGQHLDTRLVKVL